MIGRNNDLGADRATEDRREARELPAVDEVGQAFLHNHHPTTAHQVVTVHRELTVAVTHTPHVVR